MSKITIKECPLCGGKEFTPHLTCTDHYASGERFELWHCDACGFLFTQDAPSESEIGRYYDTPDYISHSNTRKGVMNRVYHVARRFQLNRVFARDVYWTSEREPAISPPPCSKEDGRSKP